MLLGRFSRSIILRFRFRTNTRPLPSITVFTVFLPKSTARRDHSRNRVPKPISNYFFSSLYGISTHRHGNNKRAFSAVRRYANTRNYPQEKDTLRARRIKCEKRVSSSGQTYQTARSQSLTTKEKYKIINLKKIDKSAHRQQNLVREPETMENISSHENRNRTK